MKKAIKKSGLSPGSLIFTGEKKLEAPRITVIAYSETSFRQTEIRSLDDLAFDRKPHGITWINVEGIHHVETIRKIGELFSLHPLILEDILNPNQRPKVEDYDNAFFAVVRMLRQNGEGKVVSEQQSLVLTRNAVISFQECCGDVFDPVRKRIADGLGQIRKMGADYLFYALLDAVVDEYFVLLEQMDDALEALQGNLVNAASKTLPLRLQQFHKDVIVLRKAIWPMRDMMANLLREETPFIHRQIHAFLRDLADHTNRAADIVDHFRDFLNSVLETHMLVVSQRMNEIMKVLAIVTTIFMPLTFIVGIYGMNFRFMPELERPWGYPVVLIIMVAIAITMLFLFRRKKWI